MIRASRNEAIAPPQHDLADLRASASDSSLRSCPIALDGIVNVGTGLTEILLIDR